MAPLGVKAVIRDGRFSIAVCAALRRRRLGRGDDLVGIRQQVQLAVPRHAGALRALLRLQGDVRALRVRVRSARLVRQHEFGVGDRRPQRARFSPDYCFFSWLQGRTRAARTLQMSGPTCRDRVGDLPRTRSVRSRAWSGLGQRSAVSTGVHNLLFGVLFGLFSLIVALESRGRLPYSDRVNWTKGPARTPSVRGLSAGFLVIGLAVAVLGVVQICVAG
jgi:hypothetical protein